MSRLSGLEQHQATYPNKPHQGALAFLGHYLLGLQLFDVLAWTQTSSSRDTTIARTVAPSHLTKAIEKVFDSLRNWPALLARAIQLQHVHTQNSGENQGIYKAKNPEAQVVEAAIHNINIALLHHNKSSFHKILYNIHALAFIAAWFLPVNVAYRIYHILSLILT